MTPALCRTRASARRASDRQGPSGGGRRGQVPRLHQDLAGAAAACPGPRTLAADRQPAHPPPRDLHLRRRHVGPQHHPQAVPAPLRRLHPPLAVPHLPPPPPPLLPLVLPTPPPP